MKEAVGGWRLAVGGTAERNASLVAVGALCAMLAGCGGSLLESKLPASTRYVMATPPPATNPTSSAASEIDLAIGRPDVVPGLDTEQIAVIRGQQLDYYRGALWRGTVLDTVQSYLVTTLQQQKLFRSVAPEQARVGGEYLLDTEVRDFQAEYTGGASIPTVRVSLTGRIIRIRERRLVETIELTTTKQATQNNMTSVAGAFEAAMQQLSLELSSRTAAIVSADKNKTSTGDTG